MKDALGNNINDMLEIRRDGQRVRGQLGQGTVDLEPGTYEAVWRGRSLVEQRQTFTVVRAMDTPVLLDSGHGRLLMKALDADGNETGQAVDVFRGAEYLGRVYGKGLVDLPAGTYRLVAPGRGPDGPSTTATISGGQEVTGTLRIPPR